jgi:hypothetical protein
LKILDKSYENDLLVIFNKRTFSMALTDEILASRKLEGWLAGQLICAEGSLTAPFRVSVSAKQPLALDKEKILTPEGNPMLGVSVQRSIADKIYLATATMEGLKALTDDDRVNFIYGSKKAHPISNHPS